MAAPRSDKQRMAIFARLREKARSVDAREVGKAAVAVAAGAGLAGAALYAATRKGAVDNPLLRARAAKLAMAGASLATAGGASLSDKLRTRLAQSETGRRAATVIAQAEGVARQAGRVASRSARTLTVPMVGTAEDIGEWAVNSMMEAAESKLAQRIRASSERLETQAARIAGTVQRAVTEEVVRGGARARARVGGALGKFGELTKEEAETLKKAQERILQDAAALEGVRRLRRRENASIRSAAAEAYQRMRMRSGGILRMMAGNIDEDIVTDLAKSHPNANLSSRDGVTELRAVSSIIAGLGGAR